MYGIQALAYMANNLFCLPDSYSDSSESHKISEFLKKLMRKKI